MNKPLTQLEMDGIALLLEQDDIDTETMGEMLAALGRAVAEIKESRPIAKAALSWLGSKTGSLQGADIGLAAAIRKAKEGRK